MSEVNELVNTAVQDRLKSMIIRLVRQLELFAFDGGKKRCQYCGTGGLHLEEGGWKPDLHRETCILAEALRLVLPEYRNIEMLRRYDCQGCPE